jgi:excinuclease ABC subunit C
MERLFAQGSVIDFGPSAFCPFSVPPPIHYVQGQRLSQLRAAVREQCPRRPGVYGMVDGHGELIYLGKAKSLRARLLGYFRRKGRCPKAGRIIRQSASLVWQVQPHEFSALLRELELIRRWRPRFNVQGQPLRRRHTHLCLGRSPAPYVFLMQRPPANVLASFGPIPGGEHAAEAVRRLNDYFGLRDCPQSQELAFADQADLFSADRSAGCIRYELGTCLGPCLGACSRGAYATRVRAARSFLTGTDASLLKKLEQEMEAAAAAEAFERAAVLRDKLTALRWLHDRLERLRRARLGGSYIYPVACQDGTPLWYLVHGGRIVTSLLAPSCQESRRIVRERIKEVYGGGSPAGLLEPYEHFDGLLLVAAWFRRYPQERKRVLSPQEALARCQE